MFPELIAYVCEFRKIQNTVKMAVNLHVQSGKNLFEKADKNG